MKKKDITLAKLKQKCQIVANEYIRLRDKDKPCISCGEWKVLQAGHYYPVKGYDGLRFDEDNIHGECAGCNCFSEGHLITYGINLERKIGLEKLNNLHAKAAEYKRKGYKFTRSEILEIMEAYKSKINEIT